VWPRAVPKLAYGFSRAKSSPCGSDFGLPRIPMGIEFDLGEVAHRFILNGIARRVSPLLLAFKSQMSGRKSSFQRTPRT
jgi:hypothetical protein